MLDRRIPFYNIILRCDRYQDTEIHLPSGFALRGFQTGDEKAWARLEYEIGDFASQEEGEQYFKDTYLNGKMEIANRCVFALDEEQRIVGACIAWRDPKGERTAASLHWLVVHPACQGKGLGRALCQRTMQIFDDLQERPVYIHTQPWSYRAILLYISLGFQLQITDTFSNYENQYAQAMGVLKGVLDGKQYDLLLRHAEK